MELGQKIVVPRDKRTPIIKDSLILELGQRLLYPETREHRLLRVAYI